MPLIALMTDFGTRDYYVPAMKGVIYQIDPKATVVDLTHELPAHDPFYGAFVLRQVLPHYPPGTVFVAVVDPGVGTERRILAARYSDRIVLAPDNGLVTLVHRDAELQEVRVVENRQYFNSTVSNTFHGRDVFAPVAAHLSRGVALEHMGPPADHIEILDLNRPAIRPDGCVTGEVALIDHFGNAITNISVVDLSASRSARHQPEVTVGSRNIGRIRMTYGEVPAGQPLALIGSSQMLEIAVNAGRAADVLGIETGTPVQVR